MCKNTMQSSVFDEIICIKTGIVQRRIETVSNLQSTDKSPAAMKLIGRFNVWSFEYVISLVSDVIIFVYLFRVLTNCKPRGFALYFFWVMARSRATLDKNCLVSKMAAPMLNVYHALRPMSCRVTVIFHTTLQNLQHRNWQ